VARPRVRNVRLLHRGEGLLREAAEIPLRPKVTLFPLEEANRALQMLKADRIAGSGVLVGDEK